MGVGKKRLICCGECGNVLVMNKSWKIEVLVDGKWCGNALRFGTNEEAEGSVRELLSRWYVPEDGRVIESDDEVNYRFVDGVNVRIDN